MATRARVLAVPASLAVNRPRLITHRCRSLRIARKGDPESTFAQQKWHQRSRASRHRYRVISGTR